MKSNPVSINVSFHGDNVEQVMLDHREMVAACWKQCASFSDSFAKIHVFPRIDNGPAEWSMTIAKPTGRRTYSVTQSRPAGPVTFAPESI